ncbi:MAG: pirin family protein [Gammaproteobacteria bacterium]|nr:MAG: pirin family protein [Gammaproteobacteria bacterium]
MTTQTATRFVSATRLSEGAGVTVHRTIGTHSLKNHDPFIMLDHFSSENPNEYLAGFPDHPHRGFNTFTYMIDGHMEHQDSMGNTGHLGPGSAQWMKAASGVIHSEMPKQEAGLMRGFQLWINLPAANKMDDPEYQEYPAEAFPIVKQDGVQLKVLVGSFADRNSPIVDPVTGVSYFDITVQAGHPFDYEAPPDENSFIYLFEGQGTLNGKPVSPHTLVTLGGEDKAFNLNSGDNGARFIFVSGRPIREPIVQYGPFVMNSREEIEQAMRDFQSHQFVQKRAWMNRKKETVS